MTQKRWLELPILLALIWIVQALELSLLHLPYYLGTPQILTLMIAYVAFSRGWTSTVILSFILAFLAAANIGYSTGVFVAAHVWSALATLTVVSALTLEGRSAFVLLVVGYDLFLKIVTWLLLRVVGAIPSIPLLLAQFFAQTAIMAIVAWLIYPLFKKWDDYFLHVQDDDTLKHSSSILG
ncbi:MAG: hypothetical protein ABIR96_09295 [Bdellovibrionota bacterium]